MLRSFLRSCAAYTSPPFGKRRKCCWGFSRVAKRILPANIARQVETLARQRDLSDNRVLVELIEQGIEAHRQKRESILPVGGTLPRRQRPGAGQAVGTIHV